MLPQDPITLPIASFHQHKVVVVTFLIILSRILSRRRHPGFSIVDPLEVFLIREEFRKPTSLLFRYNFDHLPIFDVISKVSGCTEMFARLSS